MEFFPLSSVRLDGGSFADALQTDLAYVRALEADRLLAPFLQEAGLTPKAPAYGSWEGEGLGGQTGGHYLSALSYLWAATGDDELRTRLDYAISELARAQDARGTGYVGGVPGGAALFAAVATDGVPAARAFGESPNWVPWYNLHKTFQGLIDAHLVAGDDRALEIVTRLGEWWLALAADVDDETFEAMLATEFGGMNEVFSRLALISGRDDFAAMALRFSHHAILDPLREGRDALTGLHANTQIPKAVGYAISPDAGIRSAADVFWRTVVENRSAVIGGNSVREHFHDPEDFCAHGGGPRGSGIVQHLQHAPADASPRRARAAAGAPRLGGARSLQPRALGAASRARRLRVLHVAAPGALPRVLDRRPVLLVLRRHRDRIAGPLRRVGLRGRGRRARDQPLRPGDARRSRRGSGAMRVRVETEFPNDPAVAVVLDLDAPRTFPVRLRVPAWATGLDDLAVDGEPAAGRAAAGAIVIEREWRPGARITFRVPLVVRAERLPDGSPWQAFLAGPIVLAARGGIDGLVGLRGDDQRWGHVAGGPLRPLADVPMVTDAAASDLLTETAPLRYRLRTADPADDVELEPFAGIHDARYTVYWPVAEDAAVDARRSQLRERDLDAQGTTPTEPAPYTH